MSTKSDIVFCIEHTSSIMSYFNQIRTTILGICVKALAAQSDVRIGIIKFRSRHDAWTTQVYGFTQNIDTIQQMLSNDQLGGGSPDEYEAVGDALHEALNIQWRIDNNDQIFNEKLVILITDGAPNGLFTTLNGADPWRISKKFKENNITLVVVGVSESINECDDFYCALAQKTDGQYIPLVNAGRIIKNIIDWVTNKETTFNQCFRHIMMKKIEKNSSFRYLSVTDRVNGMINECHTINDIRKIFFNHRVSTG
ncbi:unnamed protein product [Rotaria sp. Silwood1]|nr:unnamed protein product [Rotaria sp. Silwood1]